MDLKRLQTFVAVTEQGSVSRAAERLRITQPALSRQIRDLQCEFGVTLFQLVGRRLVPTGEGEEFLGHCRDLLGHAEAVADRARSLAQGDAGVLRVAATPQLIESVFTGFLGRYAQLRPQVQVKLTALTMPPVQVLVAHAPSLGLPA
jgi:DNA-binding transcriptional LysR family regulator